MQLDYAEDVHDLAEHQRRLSDADEYRPSACPRCVCAAVHVHMRPERHPRGDPLLPPVVVVLQFRCASEECGATWRVLPLFLARHLWHGWRAVERAVVRGSSPVGRTIGARTKERWRSRLASSARVLVVLLAIPALYLTFILYHSGNVWIALALNLADRSEAGGRDSHAESRPPEL